MSLCEQCCDVCRTVFVGNVPDDMTDIDLAEYFSELGEVLSASMRGHDGGHYGFVEFAHPEHVHNVLHMAEQQPFKMGDNYLKVQPRRQKEQRPVSPLSSALGLADLHNAHGST